jgi:hypothetical protein
MDRNCKSLLKDALTGINTFKQDSIKAIQASSDLAINLVTSLIDQKLLSLRTEVDLAKAAGGKFIQELLGMLPPPPGLDPIAFVLNVIRLGVDLDRLGLFKFDVGLKDIEADLAKFASFTVQFPSSQFSELIKTSDEYGEWLQEQEQSTEVEGTDLVLTRFSGDYGSWNVGAANTVEATTFTVDHDIWITGVGMGNTYNEYGETSISELEIRGGRSTQGDLLYSLGYTYYLRWDGTEEDKYRRIDFSEPVRIISGNEYTFRIHYDTPAVIWAAGQDISDSVDDVTFTFADSYCEGNDSDNNGNTVTAGPTRDIYFKVNI